MKNPTLISLIRHGQVHNPEGLFYGRMPGFALSNAGYTEAKRAALFLSKKPLTALFSSPLLRARQTANEIAIFQGSLRIKISRLLNEVNSAFEAQPMRQIESQDGEVYASADPKFDQPYDVFNRSRRFIAKILRRYAGQHVAAVTHGDIIAFTLIGFSDLPIKSESKTSLKLLGISDPYPATGSVTTLSYQTGSFSKKPVIYYSRPV